MQRKRLFMILGAISAVILLVWFTVFAPNKNLRAANNISNQTVTEITLCDVDASRLCIVTFGTIGNAGQMVINFQLPRAVYPAFYVTGSNKGTVNTYQCETAKATPTSIYCTGVRTPLGEAIDIEIYTIDGDQLMARGKVFVSSFMVLTTPIELIPMPAGKIVTPTPTATIQIEPTPTLIFTPTPDLAYPSP